MPFYTASRLRKYMRRKRRVAKKRSLKRKVMKRGGPVQKFALLGSTNNVFARNSVNVADPFPLSRTCVLCYSQVNAVQSITVTTTGNEHLFKLNSLFDPDTTGTGHQPYWFDQLNNIYKAYRVMGVRARVTFFNPSTVTCWAGVGFKSSGDSYSATGVLPEYLKEKATWQVLPKIRADSDCVLDSGYVPIHQIEGISYDQWLGDTGYQALVNANPAKLPELIIIGGDWAAPASTSTIRFCVDLTFHVKYFDRQTQNAS